jgi:predicted dehydrogenase
MDRLRIGILGTSNIAKRSVIPTLKILEDYFEIVGVGGRDYQKTKDYCELLGLKAYESYDDILDIPNLDAIYIPLPNSLHSAWVNKCLNRNIHVMCEKSLGCSYAEVDSMVSNAKKRGLMLMEHFQFRFHSQLQHILNLIQEIGELRSIRSTFGIPSFTDKNNIRYFKHLGGGALFDNGAYPIKLAQIILGHDLIIESCRLEYQKHDVDIWGNVTLYDAKSGVTFLSSFGFDHIYRCDLEIIGSKGRLLTERIFTASAEHIPKIILQKQIGYNTEQEEFNLSVDNHFKNIWLYFYNNKNNHNIREEEYAQNLSQARLLQEAKELYNVK